MPKYQPSKRVTDQIAKSFTYHAPQADQPARYSDIRDAARALANLIAEHTPESREQSTALTNLEQAVMWANAAIARHE